MTDRIEPPTTIRKLARNPSERSNFEGQKEQILGNRMIEQEVVEEQEYDFSTLVNLSSQQLIHLSQTELDENQIF